MLAIADIEITPSQLSVSNNGSCHGTGNEAGARLGQVVAFGKRSVKKTNARDRKSCVSKSYFNTRRRANVLRDME